MSRKRFITSDISSDERLADVVEESATAALMWPWLLLEFDDWGRAEANPGRIKLTRFPAFPFSVADVREAISLYDKHGVIHVYEVDGKPYMAVRPSRWIKYQTYLSGTKRATQASTFPPPPFDCWGSEVNDLDVFLTKPAEREQKQRLIEQQNCPQTSADVCGHQRTSAAICGQSALSVPSPSPSPSPSTDQVGNGVVEKNLSPDNSPESAPPRQKTKRELPEAYLSFAKKFQDEVSRRFPTLAPKVTKALVESGAETIDKLIRLDGFSLEDIRKVLLWAISDEFWSKQVRSLACLRKVSDNNGLTKFQNIQAKMQDATGPQAQRAGAKATMAMTGFTPGSNRYPREEDIPVDHYRF